MQHEPLNDAARTPSLPLTLPVAGVDVSKGQLDVFIDTVGQRLRVDNDDAGVARLLATLLEHKVRLVVVEATGGTTAASPPPSWRRASTSRWSTPSRSAPSPGPRASWRRPTGSTPKSWPASGGPWAPARP